MADELNAGGSTPANQPGIEGSDIATPIELGGNVVGLPVVQQHPAGTYIAQEYLYLGANGELLREKDQGKQTLLAAPGQPVPQEQAIRLGLVPDPNASTEAKERKGPQEDKSVKKGETK